MRCFLLLLSLVSGGSSAQVQEQWVARYDSPTGGDLHPQPREKGRRYGYAERVASEVPGEAYHQVRHPRAPFT